MQKSAREEFNRAGDGMVQPHDGHWSLTDEPHLEGRKLLRLLPLAFSPAEAHTIDNLGSVPNLLEGENVGAKRLSVGEKESTSTLKLGPVDEEILSSGIATP